MSKPVVPFGLNWAKLALENTESLHYQSPPQDLVQATLRRGEGRLSDTGALVVYTGAFTGRSPRDRFLVQDEITAGAVHWNYFNQPIDERHFLLIRKKIVAYLEKQPEVWVRDCWAGADARYRLSFRLTCDTPWTSLFACNMFLQPEAAEREAFKPEWQVLSAPGLQLDPTECGIRQHNAVVLSFRHKTILVAGTGYTGEIKKGIFSIMNFRLPQQGVLPMHCSANIGAQGDTAIFFGLSGTGKTTLSTDPARKLIGDDEHGWSDDGVFNFEGGCYAKLINLTREREPQIFEAIRPGAMVENTPFFEGTNTINFADNAITENTRVSYPLSFISNVAHPAVGGIPKNIFFLTCDAFGVLPPIARLTPEQAMYQFISGYTAKVAGTETGVTEPQPTFSACFGAPFLPLHPATYAALLGRKMQEHEVAVWLLNTGWTRGPYGEGTRIELAYTRAMITAALEGKLYGAAMEKEAVFGFAIPTAVPGMPAAILNPRNTWADGAAYDAKARYLAQLFRDNFEPYAAETDAVIQAAAPKL